MATADPDTDIEETLAALTDLIAGRVAVMRMCGFMSIAEFIACSAAPCSVGCACMPGIAAMLVSDDA